MVNKEKLLFDDETCRVCMSPKSGCIEMTSSINIKCGRIVDMMSYCFGLDVSISIQ